MPKTYNKSVSLPKRHKVEIDWVKFADGRVHGFIRDKDFLCTIVAVRLSANRFAAEHGYEVRTSQSGAELKVQFLKHEETGK